MSSLTKNPINSAADGRDNYGSDAWKPAYASSNTTDRIYAEVGKNGNTRGMSRGFAQFDTSSIPADAIISSVILKLYCHNALNPLGNGAVYICKYNSTNNYTFDNYGSKTNAEISVSATNDFSLDPSCIVKGGTTKLAVVEWHDFNNSDPSTEGINSYQFDSYDHSNVPQLVITYALVPTVTTTSASNVMSRTASSGGNVTDAGGGTISERGVCYNTAGTPTTSDTKDTAAGTTGQYTSSLTGLKPNTKYYLRAYATNEAGSAYGSEINFTTNGEGGILFMME